MPENTQSAMTAENATTTTDQPTLAEFAQVNRRRASAYSFAARVFGKEVDEELLTQMREMRFPVSTGEPKTDEGNRMLASYLSNTWGGTIQELAVDYVRTFIGSGNDAFSAAYPFESVYTSPKRLMMQEARDEVLAIYRSEGLDKSEEWKESEDHVAAELEFMEVLATRTADACDAGDEGEVARLMRVQEGFLSGHLYAWTGMFTADMRMRSQTDFYLGMASYLDGLLKSDLELVRGVLGQ